MERFKNTGSIFGNAQRTSFEYMKMLKNQYSKNCKVLVVDDVDGLHSIGFARKGNLVSYYESKKIYFNGGKIDDFNIIGIKKRLEYEKSFLDIKLNNCNFYEQRITEKYDFVYCFRSLQRESNKHISMKQKIKKLQSSVKKGGYLYIFYHLAKKETDYSNYYKNQYLRTGEMKEYFNKYDWEIISLIEHNKHTSHKKHPNHNRDHFHRVGHIFLKKKKVKTKNSFNYEIVTLF